MYRVVISDDDRKTIKYILTMYKAKSEHYRVKLSSRDTVNFIPPIQEEKVEKLIELFDKHLKKF